MRLHPPVPTSAKVAICDTILPRGGGADGESPIYIPKGLKVLYSTYSMHRRRDIWGDEADEFQPERWVGARHSWVCNSSLLFNDMKSDQYAGIC